MNSVKAFAAGAALPSLILPLLLCLALEIGKPQILTIPFLHFIPLIWGVWNILYFAFLKKILTENVNRRLLVTGALLGLLVAIYGVFESGIPQLLGLPDALSYLPLIGAPILYAILWRYVVKPLNELVGLQN